MDKVYLYYIIGVMFVFPIISIIVEVKTRKDTVVWQNIIEKSFKWFVFWAIGIRCLSVGLSQSINPKFTASILEVTEESYVIIKELGVSNTCLGIVGLGSLFFPQWRKAAACSGGLYLGVAGIIHIFRITDRINLKETIAMVSDLFILAIVVLYMLHSFIAAYNLELEK